VWLGLVSVVLHLARAERVADNVQECLDNYCPLIHVNLFV
jgi:hypothetical protein